MVVDAEDTGEVSFVQREPQVDKPITAKVSDPDGGVTNTKWQWAKANETNPTECPTAGATYQNIDGATSPTYTPAADDVDDCLQATATYEDNILTESQSSGTASTIPTDEGNMTATVMERAVQIADAANTAPEFPDQDADTSGDQSDSTTREVAENTKADTALGVEIEATDRNTDLLIHTLGGDDGDSFGIDRDNGQLKTKDALNYEEKDTYSLTITATDPSGATDTIAVTINITDENDNAVVTGAKEITGVEENSTGVLADFDATDEDGDDIEWSVAGDHKDNFSISEDGELSLDKAFSFEDGDTYSVTVQATGGKLDVTVKVDNVNEDGTVKLNKPQPQAGRGLMAVDFEDPDGPTEEEVWQWARSMDGETGWMDIEGATSQSRSPEAADVDYYLRATVTYTDMFGEGQTASVVSTNVVEARTTSNAAPSFASHDTVPNTPEVEVTRETNEGEAAGTNIGDPIAASDGRQRRTPLLDRGGRRRR